MERPKHIIENPVTGHRITLLRTGAETNGHLLRIEYAVLEPEDAPQIPEHIHQHTEERFEVLAGRLGLLLNGSRSALEAGQDIVIPPGAPHTFWNAGPGELRFITEVRPPGSLQTYWETVFGLAAEGKVGANGLPNLLQLAVVAPLADSYDPRAPLGVTRALLSVLGTVGRALGYRPRYARFSDAGQVAADAHER